MAGSRATGALRLLRRHRQQLWPAPFPDPDCQSLAWSDMAARAKATNVVGPFQCSSARQPAAAAAARARLARPSGLIRVYSPEEPDAEKLQVRICGGGGGRPPPLPDHLTSCRIGLAKGLIQSTLCCGSWSVPVRKQCPRSDRPERSFERVCSIRSIVLGLGDVAI